MLCFRQKNIFSQNLWKELSSELCTGMALKGAILGAAGKGKILLDWNGVGALAYDKDLNGNLY